MPNFSNLKWNFLLLFFSLNILLLSGCKNKIEGFNNKEIDISKANDKSLKIKINYEKDSSSGNFYSLTISGTGEAKNFNNKETPWKTISKKIKKVEIEEGVTSLGTYYFNNLNLNYYVLPKTLESFENTTFNESAILYSKNTNLDINNINNKIYYYSENVPTDSSKKYWHYVNNIPVIYEKIKVLFVGNSFTFYNNIPKLTEEIGKSLGYDLTCDSITKGSWTLTKFADESDEMGKVVYDTLKNTNDYNYVIFQDQSTRSYTHYNEFYNAVDKLNKLVQKTQLNCETRLYATWGYPDGLKENEIILTQEEKIREKYIQCGNSLNIKVHNVGKAFSKVYQENKDINLYFSDNKHPSHYGSFLSAHVHAMSILNIDTRASSFSSYFSNEENLTWTIDEDNSIVLKNAAYNATF